MFGKKKKDKKEDSKAIVRQDSRAQVRTTMAQTETTNTSLRTDTTFNNERNTVTYSTTTQTITHQQRFGVSETLTRRTPTEAELNELFKQSGSNFKTFGAFNGSTPLIQTQETKTTQNNGHKVTSSVQEQRIKFDQFAKQQQSTFNSNNLFGNSFNSNTSNNNKNSSNIKVDGKTSGSILNTNYVSPFSNRNYVSPYRSLRESSDARPFGLTPRATTTSTSTTTTTATAPYNRNLITSPSTPSITSTSSSPFVRSQSLRPSYTASNSLVSNPSTKPKLKLKPGCYYILNNMKFDSSSNEYRVGSDEDVKALEATFKEFGISGEKHTDPTRKKVESIISKIATKDFSKASCLIIVILSHGSRYETIAAKDKEYSIDDDIVFPILKNKSLADKPKLIFVQACKGDLEIIHKDAKPVSGGVPSEILKMYSTFEGYLSYRTEKGSFFIQTLCEIIRKNGKTVDIRRICENVIASVKNMSGNKQIPSMTTTLTKPFIFGDYV